MNYVEELIAKIEKKVARAQGKKGKAKKISAWIADIENLKKIEEKRKENEIKAVTKIVENELRRILAEK